MDQRQTVEAIESYAFLYITLDSRCETIDELRQAFFESSQYGHAALESLKARYPRSWFRP
jgi:hypothetical protein